MHIRAETVYIFWVRIYFSRCMIVCACEDVGQIEYDHKAHTECRQLRSISDHIGRGTLTKIFACQISKYLFVGGQDLKNDP